MNYWHMQIHPDDTNWGREKEVLEQKSVIGIGDWEKGKDRLKQFKEGMKVGDIVLVRLGAHPIALTRVKGGCYYSVEEINEELDWFPYRREVEVLEYYEEEAKKLLSEILKEYGSRNIMAQGPLCRCNENSDKATNEFIKRWHEKVKEMIKLKEMIDLLRYKKQIILQGPPGTGKTHTAKEIAEELTGDKDKWKLVQFHSSYTYEDFVRGIVAKTENNQISYITENRVLLEFANKAAKNENDAHVLIIDEINRANLSAVLGELIYALEYRDEKVDSMYKHKTDGGTAIHLPENLYIIGTMNTADRSVGHIDYAIRRRFAFIDVLPNESVIEHPAAKNLFNKVKDLFKIKKDGGFISPDFDAKDVMIGHTYFRVKDDKELKTRLEYEIKPILREYVKDGVLLDTANEKIKGLNA